MDKRRQLIWILDDISDIIAGNKSDLNPEQYSFPELLVRAENLRKIDIFVYHRIMIYIRAMRNSLDLLENLVNDGAYECVKKNKKKK